MRIERSWVLIAAVIGVLGLRLPEAMADEPEISASVLPIRYAAVSGSVGKFRAHHWMKAGFASGLKDLTAKFVLPNGTTVHSEAHAIIDENDLGAAIDIEKENLGFVNFDYTEFRKYFDTTGGSNRLLPVFSGTEAAKDLTLDIGKFGLETGLTLEGWPELGFGYEREFKDGAKSRLSWPQVKEGTITRKIAPSWQDIDEMVDMFALHANDELAGFTLRGEQQWEFVRSENYRVEEQLGRTGTTSDSKIRRQDQAPESNLMTTTLGAERHFLDDRVFTSASYHFAHLRNREFESLLEYDINGVSTNYTYPEQKPNNRADSSYNSHTWVGNLTTSPWQSFTFGTRLKSEVISRRSNSTYNHDFRYTNTSGSATAPNSIADATMYSLSDLKAARWGENISLRYTGLPRTALYTELELEQTRALMREDRRAVDGPDTGDGTTNVTETFNRETVASIRRGVWSLGGQVAPWPFLNITSHLRHVRSNTDYDDQRESDPGTTTARSAFFDGQGIQTEEFMLRTTLRPSKWLRSSLRYQLRTDKYATRVETEPIVKTASRSHIYTYDVSLQPHRDVSATASFSRQNAWVTTPARYFQTIPFVNNSSNIPTFKADVNTWLLGLDYTPPAPVSFNTTLLYSWADNFNDFSEVGQPFGAEFDRLDLTTGMKWQVRDGTTVGTEYAFYHYNPNDNVEPGDYNAHVIWFDVSQKF